MDPTVALTGMLPAIVILSALLTAAASALLLWLYRRAVVRAMAAGSGPPEAEPRLPPLPRARRTLPVVQLAPGEPVSAAARSAYRATSASLRRLGLVYLAAGLAYATLLCLPWMIRAGDGFPATRFLWLLVCYGWPTVLTLWLVAATAPGPRVTVGALYGALVVAVGGVAVARNPDLDPADLVFFWLFANLGATLLLAAFLTRRIRAVGPLVLAFVTAGVSGAFLTVAAAGSHDALLRGVASAGDAVGLGATALFVLLHLVGFALFGALGWWLLGRLGRAYRAKRTSDQALTVDALWLLFGVLQSVPLAFEGGGWVFTGLVGFAAYKLVTRLGFAGLLSPASRGSGHHPTLLLLRVFALGRRSERLFDVLSRRWLRAGGIDLIAGPDLATTTVEPHEFLDFCAGRLSRRFVTDEEDLHRRLAERDTRPDPDGRCRVNEFFCRRDTWQATMRRLAAGSDAVLMDLRGFGPANHGCLWELEQLLQEVPLDRVLFLVDATTDRPFLERQLQELWQEVGAESPNRAARAPAVRLFAVAAAPSRAVAPLVRQLLQASLHTPG
jgi:hypothetical protein